MHIEPTTGRRGALYNYLGFIIGGQWSSSPVGPICDREQKHSTSYTTSSAFPQCQWEPRYVSQRKTPKYKCSLAGCSARFYASYPLLPGTTPCAGPPFIYILRRSPSSFSGTSNAAKCPPLSCSDAYTSFPIVCAHLVDPTVRMPSRVRDNSIRTV